MKKVVFVFAAFFTMVAVNAQTDIQKAADLKSQLGPKNDSIAAIQARIDAIKGEIDALPGWRKGLFGTIGANLSGANNFFNQALPNNTSGNIGIGLNGFANLKREKYFWNNNININLQWVKIDDRDDDTDSDEFNGTNDIINLTSLFGYNLTPKIAASALTEYRTSVIDNFNDPGYLDFGIGATWLPLDGLVVVVHPLNFNIVFADENDAAFESSTGAKIVIDYTRQLAAINFKTNFTTFQSYESGNLSNWTWTNKFGYTLWNGIGLGFELGLRESTQESLANALLTDPAATLDNVDSPLQTYWLFGLNYSL